MTSVALITVYHFDSGNTEAYARLVRGLRSSIGQLGNNDRLILVANGVHDRAEDPDQVLRDVDLSHSERVVPVVLWDNCRATGGLNLGVAAALRHQCDWIGQVQSSVVIGVRWLETMLRKADSSKMNGLGGRLTYEEQTDTIWTDGHFLREGKTLDVRYDRPLNEPGDVQRRWTFPCLSAALFSSETVRSVSEKYGDFVTERLSHYGDCTDVALRCARLGRGNFQHVADALGTKRRPTLQRAEIVCFQLLAARRHYKNCFKKAHSRLQNSPRDVSFLDDSVRRSMDLHSARYSLKCCLPPGATKAEDEEWGDADHECLQYP